jgi:hypothetical protein
MAQNLSVGYQKQITVPVANALAAYSLNSRCVEASAGEGTVTISGTGPCDARVVVITDGAPVTLQVHVIPPPPGYPPGFTPPEALTGNTETTRYEFRYVSDPGQIQNVVDSLERQGNRTTELHVSTISYFSPVASQSRISLPFLFYALTTPGLRMTVFDESVTNSPLTVDGSVIRGFHLGLGRWLFHAGFTSTSSFENILLPPDKETIIGLGYRLPAGTHASVTANAYEILSNRTTDLVAKPGQIASLVYTYQLSERLKLMAEAGYSHGPGVAGKLESSRVGEHFLANLRYESGNFANLGINNFHGFFTNVDWDRQISARFTAKGSLLDDQYNLPGFRQKNLNASSSLDVRVMPRWTLFSGVGYSRFDPGTSLSPIVSGANLQAGVNYDTAHFGGGAQYQYSRNGGSNPGGQQIRGSLRGGWRRLYATGYVSLQTQTPSLSYVFAQVPGLQQALANLDLQATSPEELIELIQTDAALQSLGLLSGLAVHLSPLRTQFGSDLTWSPSQNGSQKFRLSVLDDQLQALQSTTRTTFVTFAYSRKLPLNSELSASFTLFQTRTGDSPAQLHPLADITLGHKFNSAPRLLMPVRHGSIGGTVLLDAAGEGVPGSRTKPMEGIEILLDGARRATSDRNGRYAFSRIPSGPHVVEVIFNSTRPSFFTTPSRLETDVNTEVNFGVTYSTARIIGFVRNDAAAGVPGVHVNAASPTRHLQAETDSDGKFSIDGIDDGAYEVTVDADSLPPGYTVDQPGPRQVEAVAGSPAKVDLTVQAARSISGRIITFDTVTGQLVPVVSIRVRLRERNTESVTDSNGAFLFRNLPAGEFTIVLEYGGREFLRAVQLPSDPKSLRNVDINVAVPGPR